jgi:Rrf2 family iron-sulfur cluster assembly transcriptional regulator
LPTNWRSSGSRLLTPQRLLMASVVVAIITITLKTLAQEQKARGVQVPQPKKRKKGILQAPSILQRRPMVPNSVFALGQSLMANG